MNSTRKSGGIVFFFLNQLENNDKNLDSSYHNVAYFRVRSLVVSNLHLEIKGSWFESGC